MTIPPNPGDALSRRRKLLYILLLGALTALGPFTIDLYLPGAATFMTAGLISPVVGWLGISSATPMGAVQAACILAAIAGLWLIVRPRTVPAIQ